MKLAIITDTHFGARNDSSQFNEFFKRFYDEVFFPYLDEHQIKTLVHMGDVFDRRKYINFQILRSCKQYFFEQLKSRGIEMWVIPGNHDTYFKNTNEVNSVELLLAEYDNIKIVKAPAQHKIDGQPFDFIPWICEENKDATLEFISRSRTKDEDVFCFGHFELMGYDMFRGMKNERGMNHETLAVYPTVLTGHFHHRSAKDNVYYLGSPYGFTWSDYDDPRGFHIFNTHTTELTFIENPHKIFHKIYYDDRGDIPNPSTFKRSCVKVIVVNKEDYPKFDKFIEGLYNNEVIELTIHEDFSEFESESMGTDAVNIEDTMTLLSEFVDATETAKDKEKLKTLLKTLYVEAQALEV
jgi:DNA repair exonuclease SbcCD nuclease subunit